MISFQSRVIKKLVIFGLVVSCCIMNQVRGQQPQNDSKSPKVLSTAPVCFRVNLTGNKLHGYYKKGYNMSIYGDSTVFAFRADMDECADWKGAKAEGTTQSNNAFEAKLKSEFNPNKLYGIVLPGNKKGQHHFDAYRKVGAGAGDLARIFKLNDQGLVVDTLIAVVFDFGPQTQPGEASVAACKEFGRSGESNLNIYEVFPGSVKYLREVVGTTSNGRDLKRNATNRDFIDAFELMMLKEKRSVEEKSRGLVSFLGAEKLKPIYDAPTSAEKKQGLSLPPNDDRNVNL